jgi:rhodanese-related sulfurtransferase
MRVALLLLLVPALLAAEPTTDTPADVKKALDAKTAVLLDVREAKEWDAGHFTDAKLLPLSKLKAGVPAAELKTLMPKGKVVYLHCQAGGRAGNAADRLTKLGYTVRPLGVSFEELAANLPKAPAGDRPGGAEKK